MKDILSVFAIVVCSTVVFFGLFFGVMLSFDWYEGAKADAKQRKAEAARAKEAGEEARANADQQAEREEREAREFGRRCGLAGVDWWIRPYEGQRLGSEFRIGYTIGALQRAEVKKQPEKLHKPREDE